MSFARRGLKDDSGKVGFLFGVMSFVFLTCITCPSGVNAAGFGVFTHGAEETAMMANAVAHTEGPASNYYNPALLIELAGTQVEAGTTVIAPKKEYNTGGQTYETESDVYFPSSLYVTHALNQRIALGLGVNSPFGLGTDWGKTWPGRYIATTCKLTTFNMNPNVAVKLTDSLSVSLGADVMSVKASLEKNLFLAALLPGANDGASKFLGDGEGYGYNVGLAYSPARDWSLGATYRSEIRVDLDGDAEYSNIPVPLAGFFPNTGGHATIKLPQQVTAGIAYKGIERLIVEAGARWEGWSSYDKLTLTFDQAVAGSTVNNTPKNWDDTWSYSIAVKYDLSETWSVLAGYRHEENPVPDDTFEPSVLGSPDDCYSVGIAAHLGNFTGGLGYLYQNFQSRVKNNAVGDGVSALNYANGSYDQWGHAVYTSLSYAF